MRYLRLTGRPPLSSAPEPFRLLATSEHVAAARAVAVKFTGPAAMSAVFHVDGDRRAVEEGLERPEEVVVAETAPAADDGCYLLLVLDPESVPLLEAVFEVLSWRELVAVPPTVYRDGAVHAVGEREAGFARLCMPWWLSRHAGFDLASGVAALSDRQREAVLAALEFGCYDQPRRATQEDVADVLDCAPSTASEQIQKAEAKLVRMAMR